jgi:hypothetical protein
LCSIDSKSAEETLFTLITISKTTLSQEIVDNLLELLTQARLTEKKDLGIVGSGGNSIIAGQLDVKTVNRLNEYKKSIKKAEDRLRVWLLLHHFEVDETRIFQPHYDNQLAIKFLSDLVYSGMGNLIKDPFDSKIHPDLKHDMGDHYLEDLQVHKKNKVKIHANVVEKIIEIITKKENSGDLTSQKGNIYFDAYFFMIRAKLQEVQNLEEIKEEDLPGELRNFENNLDLGSHLHA